MRVLTKHWQQLLAVLLLFGCHGDRGPTAPSVDFSGTYKGTMVGDAINHCQQWPIDLTVGQKGSSVSGHVDGAECTLFGDFDGSFDGNKMRLFCKVSG